MFVEFGQSTLIMLFSSFASISVFLTTATSIPQNLQNDPPYLQSYPNLDLGSPASGILDLDTKEPDQELGSLKSQTSSKQPVSPDETFDLLASESIRSTSDSTTEPLKVDFDKLAPILASRPSSNAPNPNVPIILPGPWILPPGIGTCEGNPENKEKNEKGILLKTVYCCIHLDGVKWSACKKFYNGFFCDPGFENTVFACCKGLHDAQTIGPGVECEDAPGESVRRKTFGHGNMRLPPRVPLPQGVGDALWNILTYPNPVVRELEELFISRKKNDLRR